MIIIDTEEVKTFLESLGIKEDEIIHLRAFFPNEDPRSKKERGKNLACTFLTLPVNEITQLQDKGYGIYLVINKGGNKDKEIHQARAVFFEHDDIGEEEQKHLWERYGLPKPTFQVRTGGKSIHSYWVFDEPLDIETPAEAEKYKKLLIDLIEMVDGDRSNKNLSRVMRLPGGYHIKPGRNPVKSVCISVSGKRYGFRELRDIVPELGLDKSNRKNWNEFSSHFRMPCDTEVPLTIALSRQSRELINSGVSEGSRNDRGAAVARDLIGTSEWLQQKGQRFEGDARELFEKYSDNCKPPIESNERDLIWDSAKSSNPSPSCPPEAIVNSIKGYVWNLDKNTQVRSCKNHLNPKEAEIYVPENHYHPVKKISFEELKSSLIELQNYEDKSEQWKQIHDLAKQSGYSTRDIKELASILSIEVPKADSEWIVTAKEFSVIDLGCDDFLFAGFLPAFVPILVGSSSGLGKTLLLYDWSYCLATGSSWGGFRCNQSHNVLIIQNDEADLDAQERIKIRGLDELDNVFIIRQFSPNLMNRLKRVIQEKNIDVVILDSLTSIQRKSGLSYKDPEYGNLIYDFKEIASSLKVTPIIVVHTNKAPLQEVGLEKIAGSYAIGAAASEAFLLDKPKDLRQDLRILIRAKSRRFPAENYLLDFNPENYSYEILGQCDRSGQLKSENPSLPEGKANNARGKNTRIFNQKPRT
jgi:RecA-family ATPase